MFALWHLLASWSEKRFGTREVFSSTNALTGLQARAFEAVVETDSEKRRQKIADCIVVVFDAARREGMSYDDLLATAMAKLEVNQSRAWPTPSADEPVEHVRGVANG